ncbi:aminotransferase class I/II-fold pyridoxal phosphate-dependent enzyme [Patulibacter sp. SYSU D01012]|uniref:trans-sulfuration enzyme family protein n=1 Tax=Patulibacter sp. SYSU D01012 TaxID=2817381 RepID=UPI001B303789|nr:aminotransferase class I/II-fold pyridoxal phosphate-dependent enzyme [Patulibacter sp. SYSU D01012]
MDRDDLRPDSLLIHGDRARRAGQASVAPPIYPTSTYASDDPEAFTRAATTPQDAGFYTRYGSPNQADAAAVLAGLEGAEAALLTASGMAAITTATLALVSAGDHVALQTSVYGGTAALASEVLERFGVRTTAVAQDDLDAWDAAITPETRLVLLETPSNPRLGVTDVTAVAEIAHARGALVAVDSTFATPIHQRPLALGADLVLHSATKYLGGHSDLLAGAIVGSTALIERIWPTSLVLGGTLGSFEAWLLLRGMRTLGMRMARHSGTALAVAQALDGHPGVVHVDYAGLPGHPGHDVATRQMTGGYGGVLAFEVRGGGAAAERAISAMRIARRAASLGGVESLAVRPAAMWATQMDEGALERAGIAPGLVRLAVGVEDPDDVVADVVAAVEAATA